MSRDRRRDVVYGSLAVVGLMLIAWLVIEVFDPFKGDHSVPSPTGNVQVGLHDAVSVATGTSHSCALLTDHSVTCWGSDDDGQASPPDDEFTAIDAGAYQTCGLRRDRTARCWGDDGSDGTPTGNDPDARPPKEPLTAVSAGREFGCGLRPNQTIACWGRNDDGQATAPRGRFTAIAAADTYACGLRSDKTLRCWGDSGFDDGTLDGEFESIASGMNTVCGRREDGVECWRILQESTPNGSFAKVAAGDGEACGIKNDRRISCWGGYKEDDSMIPPKGPFAELDRYAGHTCGVESAGTVACWGNNNEGQAAPPKD